MWGRGGRGACPPGAQPLSDGDGPRSFLHLLGLPPALPSSVRLPPSFWGMHQGAYLLSAVQTVSCSPSWTKGIPVVCAQGLTDPGLWN